MTKQVDFTAMEHASREDYELVFCHDADNIAAQAERDGPENIVCIHGGIHTDLRCFP